MTHHDTTTPTATAVRGPVSRAWVRANPWFAGVFLLGASLRVLAVIGYQPALWFPDTYTYVVTAIRPRPDLVRPAGYSFFLRLLEPFHSFGLVVIVQHLLGLATAVLIYGAIRRKVLGVIAAAVVLLDAYQIQLEHLLVSDTLFLFLVVAATVLALRPPTWRKALGIGLLLGAATITRTVGLPLIVVFLVLYGWRARRLVGVFAVGALVPVVAYGAWFSSVHDRVGLVGANGAFLYVRVMPFADCSIMKPPADLAVLCDDRKVRPPAQDYVWDATSPLVRLPGETFTAENDALAQRFSMLAITRQPGDYLATAARDLVRAFEPGRPVYPNPEVYATYEFPEAIPAEPQTRDTLGVELARRYENGPISTQVIEPVAGWLRNYQSVLALPGPLLLLVLLVPVIAARRSDVLIPWAVAWALLVVPAATAVFDYRYVLPVAPLAFLAAALALSPAMSAKCK
ncbi:hypothetical protein [Herbidospora mongoliensis]|uniref:hypothetical protein n=1 Tax=Herbidospora mongoliensis TaxID=688067 RepID=UPI0012F855D5|nr:hypothetical protein [Herbidospora mongoliensis]